ncbi:MAG: hypothetical protein L3J69_13805 [Desulfobacula sp.]|nr:hypothetical protein [Desulfobacula sp.]
MSKLNSGMVFFIVFFLLSQPGPVFTAERSAVAKKAIASLDDDPVLNDFRKIYTRIEKKSKKGELSRKSADNADLLVIELKKYLISTKARLEILKMDTLSGKNQNQTNAVEKLIKLAAEQERVKLSYLDQLKSIEGNMEKSTADAIEKPTRWKTKNLDFEIEIEPEDITKGTQE